MIFNLENAKPIKASDILDNISEEELYSYYFGEDIKHDKLYNCPFHEDKTPSLGFKKMASGRLIYNCFGCGAKGTIFKFIGKLNNINYGETIQKISKDFNLRQNNSSGHKIYTGNRGIIHSETNFYNNKSRTQIYPTFRNWSKIDFDYWWQYYISLDLLLEYEVNPCSVVYIRKKDGTYLQYTAHSDKNPIYHYNIDGTSKVYRPLNPTKSGKWLSNSNSWSIQGLKQLPKENDLLFITSSLKDVIVLRLLGYSAIAPNGEGVEIPDKIMDYLFATNKEIILFYNNDDAGKKYSEHYSKLYNVPYILIPDEYPKDPSDLVKQQGLEYSKILIDSLL